MSNKNKTLIELLNSTANNNNLNDIAKETIDDMFKSKSILNKSSSSVSSDDFLKLLTHVQSIEKQITTLKAKVSKVSINESFTYEQSLSQLSDKISKKANSSELLELKNNVITTDKLETYATKAQLETATGVNIDYLTEQITAEVNRVFESEIEDLEEFITTKVNESFTSQIGDINEYIDSKINEIVPSIPDDIESRLSYLERQVSYLLRR
jgi:hypothetical protein